jgi:hypothetical protein
MFSKKEAKLSQYKGQRNEGLSLYFDHLIGFFHRIGH